MVQKPRRVKPSPQRKRARVEPAEVRRVELALQKADQVLARRELGARVQQRSVGFAPRRDVIGDHLAEDQRVRVLFARGGHDRGEHRLWKLGRRVDAEAVDSEARPASHHLRGEVVHRGLVDVQQRLTPRAVLVVAVARLEPFGEGVRDDVEPRRVGRRAAPIAHVEEGRELP